MRRFLILMLSLCLIVPAAAASADCVQAHEKAAMAMPAMANHHRDSSGHAMPKGHECIWCFAFAQVDVMVPERPPIIRPQLHAAGFSPLTGQTYSPDPPPPRT